MSKIKAVLFDFDGTIMDTNEIILESWRHTFKTVLGRECRDEEVVGTFGEVLGDSMKMIFPDRDVDEMISIYRSYQHQFYEKEILLCPGIHELILKLKALGYLTAIVTSRIENSTRIGLSKFGLDDKFEAFVSCDDITNFKPDPESCLVALRKLGIKADEAIYVGDSKYDIQCAHRAGVKAVLVNWTICLPKDQRVGENKADFEIDDPMELIDILDKLM